MLFCVVVRPADAPDPVDQIHQKLSGMKDLLLDLRLRLGELREKLIDLKDKLVEFQTDPDGVIAKTEEEKYSYIRDFLIGKKIVEDSSMKIYHVRINKQPDQQCCGYYALVYADLCLRAANSTDQAAAQAILADWNNVSEVDQKISVWKSSFASYQLSHLVGPTSTTQTDHGAGALSRGHLIYIYEEQDSFLTTAFKNNQVLQLFGSRLENRIKNDIEGFMFLNKAIKCFRRKHCAIITFFMSLPEHCFGVISIKIESEVSTFLVDGLNSSSIMASQQADLELLVGVLNGKYDLASKSIEKLLQEFIVGSDNYIARDGLANWIEINETSFLDNEKKPSYASKICEIIENHLLKLKIDESTAKTTLDWLNEKLDYIKQLPVINEANSHIKKLLILQKFLKTQVKS
jgi:hypothetical protein